MSTLTLSQLIRIHGFHKVSIGSGDYDLLNDKDEVVCRGSVFEIGSWISRNTTIPAPRAPYRCVFHRWRTTGDLLAVYPDSPVESENDIYYHATFESIGADLVTKEWLDFYTTRVHYPEYLQFLAKLTKEVGSHEVLVHFPEAKA